jgi:hypothetical protein
MLDSTVDIVTMLLAVKQRKTLDSHRNKHFSFFDVSLTVHLSITLGNDQLDAQILIHLLQSTIRTI